MQNICYNCFHYAPEGQVCPYCKYDPRENEGRYRLALKPGTILVNRYLIGRVLGQGGFGITYVALDNETKSRVAVKEYMPTEYASRDEGTVGLLLNDNSVQADFEYGREQFLQEAKTLTAFVGNEHIIGIRDMFEANGTAYFAMEFAEGVDLKKHMEQNGGPLRIYEANRILLPIMEALQWVHSKGIVHRDISPDNIMVKRDGTAKLIDFGAARYSTGEKSKSLDVVLKHGFAPMEQYSRRGRQGPFTDVYAMAATYYYAITGKVPPDAVDRMSEDELQPPSALGVNMKEDTEQVLMKALALNAPDRWQTMAAFYSALLQTMPQPFEPGAGEGTGAAKKPSIQKEKSPEPGTTSRKPAAVETEKPKKKKPTAIIAAVLILAVLAGVVFGTGILKKNPAVPEPTPSAAPTETAEPTPEMQEPAAIAELETEQEPALAQEETDTLGDFRTVGSIVTFGAYEQDNDLENGKEPIEWIVLDVQDGKSLLISRYALDYMIYNPDGRVATWETCSLRKWLNSTFVEDAFSSEEQEMIPTVTVTTDKNPDHDTNPGRDSQDRVFLLSIQEAEKYFASEEERKCKPSPYAETLGAFVDPETGSTWWWLRSPGYNCFYAACIDNKGAVYTWGGTTRTEKCVRPVLWLDLETKERLEKETAESHPAGDIATVGSAVTFGVYEQDNDLTNGKEPIEWIVLDVQDGRSLLISQSVLDCQPYKQGYRSGYNEVLTWETCSLRTWLNDTFMQDAFSTEEQARIQTVTITTESDADDSTNPDNSTTDQIFVISISEVEAYFASDAERQCKPTAYAITQGCYADDSFDGACFWWLRDHTACSRIGGIDSRGVRMDGSLGIRPALWINWDS